MNKTSYIFKDDGTYPNNTIPLVLFKQAIQSTVTIDPGSIETVFHENNWVNSWRNGLFGVHHYHSTAHESLGVYSGWVKAQLGGPGGEIVTVEAGDVVIIPAGVAHKNIDQSTDFKVVGAYPTGQIPDMKYGKPGERPETDQNIQNVDLPEYDPVYGKNGPLIKLWR
nr:hypothetical protein [uncultured Desulfobacter sp.]